MTPGSSITNIWSSGYELSLPIKIELGNGKLTVCDEVVRAMPGRRYVCRGKYGDKAVFIKLFAPNNRAYREWQDERRGIEVLAEAGIAAPVILYSGRMSDDSAQLIVYSELPGAESARQRWDDGNETSRRQLRDDLVELVARHHKAGLRHSDLHLLNFIYSEGVLYTLDAGDIRQLKAPLSTSDCIDGLADMLALLPVEYDHFIPELYARYCDVSGCVLGDAGLETLRGRVIDKRRYKLRKYLKKVFRSCSAFVSRKRWNEYVVYDRNDESEALLELVFEPDESPLMKQAEMLKDGNTCTVTGLLLDGRPVVCKRYNIKGFWHALSRAFRPSRAARSWRNAHHLLLCGIATARPIALREQRFGPLRRRAWFYTEKIEGESLHYYLCHESEQASETFREIAQAFVKLFDKMVLERISHGDMKISNFIYDDHTLYVIDLDSMQAHDNEANFARAFSRDMRRFFRNWQNQPDTEAMFYELLKKTRAKPYLPEM